MMQYDKAKKYAEGLLKNLSEELSFHNSRHTLNDVMPAAIHLAINLEVNDESIALLKTAVLFHDLGYLQQYKENEAIGAKIAEEQLPQYGYTEREIEVVCKLILATKLPQMPSTLLEKIICDADLDSLHRQDFIELGLNLRHEISIYIQDISLGEWINIQLELLKSHKYFTNVDKQSREQGKLNNIALLESEILNLSI